MKQFKIPEGMRDLILGECEIKKQLQLRIESCLDKWGYKEVITPMIEYYKTYEEGFADIKEEDMYKFFDAQGRIVMLRADMTIPIARVVATKFKDSPLPLRFRYCANVFKVHEAMNGLKNEITDCGVELIGLDETCGDLEILVSALEALKVIENKEWILEIGTIQYFKEACKLSGIKEEEYKKLAFLIDNKSMKSLEEYLNALTISSKQKAFFIKLPWLNGDIKVLAEAKEYAFHDSLLTILEKLENLYTDLIHLGYSGIRFDLGKTAKLDYYTGMIFDAYVEGVGNRVLSGGRYDSLIGKFGRDVCAVGFSIKLDTLLESIEKQEKNNTCRIYYPFYKRVEAIEKAKALQNTHIVELIHDESYKEICVVKEE